METKQHLLTINEHTDKIINDLEYLFEKSKYSTQSYHVTFLKNIHDKIIQLRSFVKSLHMHYEVTVLKLQICKDINSLIEQCKLKFVEDKRASEIVKNIENEICLVGFTTGNQYNVGQKGIDEKDNTTDKKFVVVKASFDCSDKPNSNGVIYPKEVMEKAFSDFIKKQSNNEVWKLEHFIHDTERNAIIGEFHLDNKKQTEKQTYIIHYQNMMGIKVFHVLSAIDEDTARKTFKEDFPNLEILTVNLFENWLVKINENNSKI